MGLSMHTQQQYAVDLGSLHKNDSVFLGNRRMVVLSINFSDRRVLIRGRKHSCGNCDLQWVEANELSTRPSRLFGVQIESLNQMREAEQEAIHWNPRRIPEPTNTVPGSADRIEVYRHRIERGERLFHADDAGCEGMLGDVRTEGEEWAAELFLERDENSKLAAKLYGQGA